MFRISADNVLERVPIPRALRRPPWYGGPLRLVREDGSISEEVVDGFFDATGVAYVEISWNDPCFGPRTTLLETD